MRQGRYIFVHKSEGTQLQGTLASLDVQSMFTNVLVRETTDTICHNAYNHPTLTTPPFNEEDLRKLLLLCTTRSPFTNLYGTMYLQRDGVSMGSPLGVLFANYYMTYVDNAVFREQPDFNILFTVVALMTVSYCLGTKTSSQETYRLSGINLA